jgi:hypothetical protein
MNAPAAREVDDSLQNRMIRAARLDATLYAEVKADPAAMAQAVAVVLLTAVATGIGFGQGDLQLIVMGIGFALIGWYLTAHLTWLIGTRLLPERRSAGDSGTPPTRADESAPPPPAPATPLQLLRTIGFANSPGLLRLFAVVPELRVLVIAGTTVWMLCATVVAIRQGLGFQSTARAAVVYLVIQLVFAPLVLLFANPEAGSAP